MSRQGYTRIPNALISDATLSLAARMVYVYIASQGKDWVFYPEVMDRELGICHVTRKRLLKELEEAGAIEWEKSHGKRGGSIIKVNKVYLNQDEKVNNVDDNTAEKVNNLYSDHLLNNKKNRESKKCAHAREALSQDFDHLKQVFEEATKKAAEELGLLPGKRDMVVAFHKWWMQPTKEGVPLWVKEEKKRAFDHKMRLEKWINDERKPI